MNYNKGGVNLIDVAAIQFDSLNENRRKIIERAFKKLQTSGLSSPDVKRTRYEDTYIMKVPPDMRITFSYLRDGTIIINTIMRLGSQR